MLEVNNSENGTHIWYNAPSGTAGDPITFTQVMELDVSGNLGIGTISRFPLMTEYGGFGNNVHIPARRIQQRG